MAVQVLPVKPVSRPPKPARSSRLTPWFWLAPALFFLTVFLVYPVIDTFVLSFMNGNSTKFVGWDNYAFVFTNSGTINAILNNLLWVLLWRGPIVL